MIKRDGRRVVRLHPRFNANNRRKSNPIHMKAKAVNAAGFTFVASFGVFAIWYIVTAVRMVIESGAYRGH